MKKRKKLNEKNASFTFRRDNSTISNGIFKFGCGDSATSF